MARLRSLIAGLALFCAAPALAQQPARTIAKGDATITLGGTAQYLFSSDGSLANAITPADGAEVCNPDASVDLWVSDSGVAAANAAGSDRVPANGGCYIWRYQPLGPISVVGATTGKPVTARRW
ncbi:hypothetical protein SAMN05519103_00349 [Rhizobiales bacterium GAS113]|nr:hypothetical protein SAMN05519103_00349 [Rhizobiales bacterium GAS113]